MSADEFAEQIVALVRRHLPYADADDLDELREALDGLGALPGPEVKFCPGCDWFGCTTSTHCGQCRTLLRRAADVRRTEA